MTLQDQARQVLKENLREADYNGKHYRYTVPSAKAYPFQWFWDSCFHAIALCKLGDFDSAKAEIDSLLAHQQSDGFIPHLTYWDKSKTDFRFFSYHWLETKPFASILPFFPKPNHSQEIQPPVLALAGHKVFEASKDKKWYASVLPKIELYYRWLENNRCTGNSHLISIIAPYESGMDQSPPYDIFMDVYGKKPKEIILTGKMTLFKNKLLGYDSNLIKLFGPFLVSDVLVNSIYAQNLYILGHKEKSTKVLDSLIKYCWDEERGLFFNIDSRTKQKAKIATVASLMPLIIPGLPKEIAEILVKKHLLNKEEFYLPYTIPSVAKNEKEFQPDENIHRQLWRGSTWINTNWFLINGLKLQGYTNLANELSKKTKHLVEKYGFWEFFNPITGHGGKYAAPNLGWSTLAVDL